MGLLLLTTGVVVFTVARDLPDIGDVKSVIKNQTTYVYASDGSVITRLFQENRTIVPLKDISPTLQKAVISVEDQRFYKHRGIDYIRIIGALIRDLKSGEAAQGGSTITQQYVKNAYFSPEKTVTRKIKEALLALELERNYTKDQILEKYLNTIYFGSGAHGIEAASQLYFGVPASKLNVQQSALLAGLIKSPEGYNPYKYPEVAQKRRDLVLDLMVDQGYITSSQGETAKATKLAIQPKQTNYVGIAPYFTEWIKTELKKLGFDEKAMYSQGLKVYTTLDPEMQENAESAWKKYLPSPKDPAVAIVAIDPKTGGVRAMVGGKDFDKQKFNIAAQWPGRQPGSSFKPFTLAAGLMNGVSPDDGFDASSPRTFNVPGSTDWEVHNYSGEGGAGYVDLRQAMARSVNVVFAELITDVGADEVVETARDLGIKSKLNADPAITLGGVERGVTPLEMANAYATFANNGTHNDAHGIAKIVMPSGETIYEHKSKPTQAIDEAVAALVNETLKGVVTGGTGTRARIGRPAAGKTGTTQKYVDAWFCGYTPDLVATVWVGYPGTTNVPMTNVRGIRVAGGTFPAQIWAQFMKKSLRDVKAHDFEKASRSDLTSITLCDQSNLLPTDFCPEDVVSSHVFVKKYKPKITKQCDIHEAIVVPDVAGLQQAEAVEEITELKLNYTVINTPSSEPSGQVVEQKPAAGTEVAEGTIVELSVSTGQGMAPGEQGQTVPNVVGMMVDEANNTLENFGFTVTEEFRLSDQPRGQVIGQRPPAGFSAQQGSNVVIVVSGESGNVRVPNVVGRSQDRARAMLEAKGFEVVVFNDTNQDNLRKYGVGMVSKQSPEARVEASRGTKVTIYVTTRG